MHDSDNHDISILNKKINAKRKSIQQGAVGFAMHDGADQGRVGQHLAHGHEFIKKFLTQPGALLLIP